MAWKSLHACMGPPQAAVQCIQCGRTLQDMASRRKSTSGQTKVVEGAAGLGAAIGLLTAHGTGVTRGCQRAVDGCASQSFFAGFEPYVTGALRGVIVGCGIAVLLILIWRWRSQPARATEPRRQAIPERVRHEV